MPEGDNDHQRYIAAAAAMMGLSLDQCDLERVERNLLNFRDLYQTVQDSDESDAGEPLGVFRP